MIETMIVVTTNEDGSAGVTWCWCRCHQIRFGSKQMADPPHQHHLSFSHTRTKIERPWKFLLSADTALLLILTSELEAMLPPTSLDISPIQQMRCWVGSPICYHLTWEVNPSRLHTFLSLWEGSFFLTPKNWEVMSSNDMFWLLYTFHVRIRSVKLWALYGQRSVLTCFIYLTWVSLANVFTIQAHPLKRRFILQ